MPSFFPKCLKSTFEDVGTVEFYEYFFFFISEIKISK